MNSEQIKNNDPLQLQQMIIFLKAELAKNQLITKKLQERNHYSLVVDLERENSQLQNETNQLLTELQKLKRQFELQVHHYKAQTNKKNVEIETLRKKEKELRSKNNQLTETINKMKDEFNRNALQNKKQDKQVSSLHRKLFDYHTKIEQLEDQLIAFIGDSHSQVHAALKNLEQNHQERSDSNAMKQQLFAEIELKNKTIQNLQRELSAAKKQTERQQKVIRRIERKLTLQEERLANIPTIDSEMITQLDQQMKEVLDQTLAYEKKLNAKFLSLNELDHKLDQLAIDLNGNQIFNVQYPISKKT